MKYHKTSVARPYNISIRHAGGNVVMSWDMNLCCSGLAAAIRSVDTATDESSMRKAIGLKPIKKKKTKKKKLNTPQPQAGAT